MNLINVHKISKILKVEAFNNRYFYRCKSWMPCLSTSRKCMQHKSHKCRPYSHLSWKYFASKSLPTKDKHLRPQLLLQEALFYNLNLHLKDQHFSKYKICKIFSEVISVLFLQMTLKVWLISKISWSLLIKVLDLLEIFKLLETCK